jgi:predicted transcriptional regulator
LQAQALGAQGWSISAIARHLDVTRLTVRRYLNGERVPGQRARSVVDPFEEFAEYCRLRLAADPHLWATTLFDEVVELGSAVASDARTKTTSFRPDNLGRACVRAEPAPRTLNTHHRPASP